jgi:hypothetical protein
MKRKDYIEAICRPHCEFYKPGRDRQKCGGYEFIERNLTAREVEGIETARPGRERDEKIRARALACSRCAFLEDGCDFRAGLDSPPCGGYLIIDRLLKG